MAFAQVDWFSNVLAKNVATWILHPDVGSPPFPTLYLLHGLGDDHTTWMRRTRLEVHAAAYPFIIVMPDGFRGFYTNAARGPRYADYIADELPAMIERTYRTSGHRAIAGQSMGGYGALRLGLGYPGRYASISSHSGGLLRPIHPMPEVDWQLIFGDQPKGSEHDLVELAWRAKSEGKKIPPIQIDCGVDDHLLGQNREYHLELEKLGVGHEYMELPGGHNWDYWEGQIPGMLGFHAKRMA